MEAEDVREDGCGQVAGVVMSRVTWRPHPFGTKIFCTERLRGFVGAENDREGYETAAASASRRTQGGLMQVARR